MCDELCSDDGDMKEISEKTARWSDRMATDGAELDEPLMMGIER